MVDGDEIRRILKFDISEDDYSPEKRKLVAERICEMCAWLDAQDINVVCCTMSFFEDLLKKNRETHSLYTEALITAPMEVLHRRKPSLYTPALKGEAKNVIGVDLPYNPPPNPDLVIDNTVDAEDLVEIALKIIETAEAG